MITDLKQRVTSTFVPLALSVIFDAIVASDEEYCYFNATYLAHLK